MAGAWAGEPADSPNIKRRWHGLRPARATALEDRPVSFPTTSEEHAMSDYPDARASERDTLLDMVSLNPRITLVDLQAAGGYVSDEAYRRLGGKAKCICVGPSPEFSKRIRPIHKV